MEAVPRLPMLSFDLKVSPVQPNFQNRLKTHIRYNYNEDPDSYSNQINQMEGLRASATHPPRDVSGCATLKRYYSQLHFLATRFPLEKGGEAALTFVWRDLHRDVVVEEADVNVEFGVILYNIGALHSQLGADDPRTTTDGMKMACTHFQCAAWAFQHITEKFPKLGLPDLREDFLLFLHTVCLGQAQECILEKSLLDNRKALIISKVAAQTVEFYKQAFKIFKPEALERLGLNSRTSKKWTKYLQFKIAYHSCISLLHQGQQAEEQQKMGERAAYCQAAFDKLEEARGLIKGMDNIEIIKEALTFTADVVEAKRKAAKSENDFIYHENVPDPALLPEIKGASLVKGIPFDIHDKEVSGPDIFARLVPMTAHESSSMYSEELAKLLRKTTHATNIRNDELNAFMSTLRTDYLNVPGDVGQRLPSELVDRCAAFSAITDPVKKLVDGMNALSDVYQDVEGMLKEIQELLNKEKSNEDEYQGVVGKRPPSNVTTDLSREAVKYQEAHKKASESNETLHKAMMIHIGNLKLLTLPLRELESQVPLVKIEPSDAMREMQMILNKVNEMRTQRASLMNQFRESINQDDITQSIVVTKDLDKDQLFQEELKKHQGLFNLIHQNLVAQEKIIAAVKEAYTRLAPMRGKLTEQTRKRDAFISGLIASHDAFEDLLEKCAKGQEFYNKLSNNVSKLLTRVKGTCKVQEEEREQILAQNIPKEPKLKLKDFLKKRDTAGTVSIPAVRPAPVGSEETEVYNNQLDAKPYIPPAYPVYSYHQEYYQEQPMPESFHYQQLKNQISTPANQYYPDMTYAYSMQYPDQSASSTIPYQELNYPQSGLPNSSDSSKSPSISSQSSLTTAYGAPYVNENEAWNYYPYNVYGNYPTSSTYTATHNMEYTTTGSESYTVPTGPIQDPTAMAAYYNNQQLQYNPYMQAGSDQPATTSMNNQTISSPVVNKLLSNFDLLAGLDMDVKDEPLVPKTMLKESIVVKEVAKEEAKPKVLEVKEERIEVKDVLKDDELLIGFRNEVTKFEKIVGGLMVKTLNGPSVLEYDWKKITDQQVEECSSKNISVARCYSMKNRFPDILPYDENRVELPSTKDDYINASQIPALRSGLPPFIATQAPIPVTYADFWVMVLEQQIEVIVCLLNDLELSGHVYWPVDKARVMAVGKLRISLQTCNEKSFWVERVIGIMDLETKISRVVVHLQFTHWPGSSFPTTPAPFLLFIQECIQFFRQQRSRRHPAVIHCLSGVGRTGLFALVAYIMHDIHSSGIIPDVTTVAASLNCYRKNALRDREHLKFAYQSILFYCQDYLNKRGFEQNQDELKDIHISKDLVQDVNKLSISDVTDPVSFSLGDEKASKKKQKFTPENFVTKVGTITDSKGESDPFSSLDPLWSLKK